MQYALPRFETLCCSLLQIKLISPYVFNEKKLYNQYILHQIEIKRLDSWFMSIFDCFESKQHLIEGDLFYCCIILRNIKQRWNYCVTIFYVIIKVRQIRKYKSNKCVQVCSVHARRTTFMRWWFQLKQPKYILCTYACFITHFPCYIKKSFIKEYSTKPWR